MPLPRSPPAALLLPWPFDALPYPPLARHPSSQTVSSASAPAPFRLPPGFPGTAAFSPETPPPRFHPRHSARTATPRLFSALPSPDASTGSAAWKLSRNQGAGVSTSPRPLDWMPRAPDRLTHIE